MSADDVTIRAGQMTGTASRSTGERPAAPRGLSAVLVAMRTTRMGSLRGRRLLGMLLVVALPLVVQAAVLAFADGRAGGYDSFATIIRTTYLGMVVPLVCIFLGTACLGDEWESGTAPFLIGSPLSRVTIVLGRWLAALRRALILVIPSVLGLYVLALSSFSGSIEHYASNLAWTVSSVALLIAGYTATFTFFGVVLRHSIMASLVFLALIEGLVAQLPVGLSVFSLGFHARNILWQATLDERYHVWGFDDLSSPLLGVVGSHIAFVIWIAVFVGLSTLVLRTKESRGSASAAGDAEGAGA